ncbi:motility associated factor glycosyltransferase family protein [Lederbergia wuyishanensis]|uniref:DUF115 domain-containing protein n=1 Tax=Lederbergia wuyishanensis TaxID=1347903 RepID=A0ABU0D8S2_9BACI|nr:6-hydroxymethylpterin diphosphokinase MptE-like protein [Lederbergia wuyishanensis]MCJ8007602.1 DUF115 domain-containing protein [Lederbergia wuyishanensis]MDQ0344814.1 hypothetical protein [Lederbergia wuyishanensis]
MILINNRNYLRLQNRPLLNKMNEIEEQLDEQKVTVETSRKEVFTLKINVEGKMQYVHSKYDPIAEAKRLIDQLQDIESYDHVLFIGAGLGYHIKQFSEVYPDIKISIYEPNLEVLYHFFSIQDMRKLYGNIGNIFTSMPEDAVKHEVEKIIQTYGKNILFFTLPVYEKLYQKEVHSLLETFKNNLKDRRSSIATNASFQKRWTINSIKNFPTILRTPNILYDVDKKAFEGKPAIIVAAGPSLSEEFENLRYIKDNGLAYIFSVGSAINALIEHGIFPDAACTYDPTHLNQVVIQKVKDRNITEIPLIFGSSVGYETIENYPGPMFHMITSQDTITGHFISNANQVKVVLDAPSIAVVTFQLLNQLGSKQIILVGQNLAYQNDQLYAEGIKYDFVSNELDESELGNLLSIKDVNGNEIKTNEDFNRMRAQLELYIQASNDIEVINTTKGGAKIDGTTFIPLDKVILYKLKSNVVNFDWLQAENSYDLKYVKNQLVKMKYSMEQCKRLVGSTLYELKVIEGNIQMQRTNQLEYTFVKFDKEFGKMKNNQFYKAMIEPMMRVQTELLSEKSKKIKYENNLLIKGQSVLNAFGPFLFECETHYEFATQQFEEMKDRVDEWISTLKIGEKDE